MADLHYQKGTAVGVNYAIAFNPIQAKYWSWLGEMHELQGEDPSLAWRQAVDLNPADAGTCIRLALHTESSGDLKQAEQLLLRAAAVDHQFEPKATLANFYFRRQQSARFWHWVREAVSMDYADARPLFHLCWQMSQDPAQILQQCVPEEDRTYRKYLGYLVAQGNVDAAATVFHKFDRALLAEDTEMLLGYCDVLLAAGRGPEAREVWNSLAAQRLIPYAANRDILINGSFETDLRRASQRAFAWKLSPSEALDFSLLDAPRALEIVFSGNEAESLEVLGQTVVVEPGRRYKLSYTYRSAEIKPATGLRWRIVAGEQVESADLSAQEWKTESVGFTATLKSVASLSLVYNRPIGATRIRGSVALRELQIEPQP